MFGHTFIILPFRFCGFFRLFILPTWAFLLDYYHLFDCKFRVFYLLVAIINSSIQIQANLTDSIVFHSFLPTFDSLFSNGFHSKTNSFRFVCRNDNLKNVTYSNSAHRCSTSPALIFTKTAQSLSFSLWVCGVLFDFNQSLIIWIDWVFAILFIDQLHFMAFDFWFVLSFVVVDLIFFCDFDGNVCWAHIRCCLMIMVIWKYVHENDCLLNEMMRARTTCVCLSIWRRFFWKT